MNQYRDSRQKNNIKAKNVELRSTNYLKLIASFEQQNIKYSRQNSLERSSSTQSQSSWQEIDIPEEARAENPYMLSQLSFISSLLKPSITHLSNTINEKKRNYSQLVKKKDQNRQKFLEKINQSLSNTNPSINKSTSGDFAQKLEEQSSSKETIKYNNNIKNRNQQQTKMQKEITKQQQNLDMHQKQELDFILSSKRDDSQNKSKKKKVVLKGKSLNSSQKMKDAQQQNNCIRENLESTLYKSIELNAQSDLMASKSNNQFLFLQQYQKDQKQIMNRLLTIIEKDYASKAENIQKIKCSLPDDEQQNIFAFKTQNRSLRNSIRMPQQQFETQYSSMKPIVINNYIKSPTQMLDRSLIEKQIFIRLLEQNKIRKQCIPSYSVANSRINLENSIMLSMLREKNFESGHQIPTKQRSIAKYQSRQQNDEKKKQSKLKLSFQCDKAVQNSHDLNSQENFDFQELYQKFKNGKKQIKNPKQRIKTSFHQSSAINPTYVGEANTQNKIQLRKYQIGSQKQSLEHNTQNPNFIHDHQLSHIVTEFNPNLSIRSKQSKTISEQKKQSVLMEIPFKDQNQIKSNVSLADAFKKKFGNKKLQSKAETIKNYYESNNQRVQSLSELKISQNIINPKQNVKTELLKIDKLSEVSKNRSLKIKKGSSSKDKENFNFIQTPRYQSSNNSSTERSICTNMTKQPSKQLLDRLIYGHKANISKKQMYELTKKNYMKLPQIEEKRKQEEKRLKQIERLDKIKQYQKRIRSNRNSRSKIDSMKTSIESNCNL